MITWRKIPLAPYSTRYQIITAFSGLRVKLEKPHVMPERQPI